MIKMDVVDEGRTLHLYVEGSSDSERDNLDKAFQVIMSNRVKEGGFKSSTKFDVVVLKEEV